MDDLEYKILSKMDHPTLASFANIIEDSKPWSRYVVVKADEQLNIMENKTGFVTASDKNCQPAGSYPYKIGVK